jgi:hypothetical protein
MNKTNFKSLAKISSGTKRKKREINILEVAEEMNRLYTKYNSLDKLSKLVKLSPEMVREFLKINDLDKSVKDLIKNDSITSIDIGYRISKLEKRDQTKLAKHIITKKLSSDDVRAIVKFKIDNPGIPIEKAIERVIKSKDKNIYIAYLGITDSTFKQLCEKHKSENLAVIIRRIFDKFIPRQSVVSFELNGRVIVIKVSKEGLQKMREKAKLLNVPLAKLADSSIKEYMEGTKQWY